MTDPLALRLRVQDEKLVGSTDTFLTCLTVLDAAEQNHQTAYLDKAYEQLSGYTRDELLGRPFLEAMLTSS